MTVGVIALSLLVFATLPVGWSAGQAILRAPTPLLRLHDLYRGLLA
ncbi:MAG: hypothetical protein QOK27_516, partial [Gemmatimonadales bacterium]|nr:hypothetical protein [Gemmatimonadales bacterium]